MNACACGRLSSLRQWWDQLCKHVPGFGYFPNASKTWQGIMLKTVRRSSTCQSRYKYTMNDIFKQLHKCGNIWNSAKDIDPMTVQTLFKAE